MTLDQRVSGAARRIAGAIEPPLVDVDAIRSRARAGRRRRTALVVTALAAAVIGAGAVVTDRDAAAPDPARPAPPVQSPTQEPTSPAKPWPRSMTPEQVVARPGALLTTIGVAPDDPDTRLSVWSVQCSRPCAERGPFSFEALALTTDAYATTTFVRPVFEVGVDLHVTTPRRGTFLLVDESNGHEWLVGVDGTQRRVVRVGAEIRPADPDLWYPCTGGWRQTWCSLDLDTATAHQWPNAWDGSAVRPGLGVLPWGANPKPHSTAGTGRLEAWWDTVAGRQVRTLARVTRGDYVLDTAPGEMAYWAAPGPGSVDLYTSRDGGATWTQDTRPAPDLSETYVVRRSPTGAYLAMSAYPDLVVWRAEADDGAFREVLRREGGGTETSGAGLRVADGLVVVSGFDTVAVSDDDGLTWTEVRQWR